MIKADENGAAVSGNSLEVFNQYKSITVCLYNFLKQDIGENGAKRALEIILESAVQQEKEV